ncbi:MAG: DUF4358 domain-containing protein [Ruminococcaceae bacterium]|nr:DUF4358 domain-containing protein [Oscillospiraceae bacterium]
MKRLLPLILLLCLSLTLTSCSLKQNKPPFPQDLPRTLLDSDTFSEPLEQLDADIIQPLYGLDESDLDPEQLTAATVHRSSGATCEELALLTFTDEGAAQTAVNALNLYITAQISSNRDYRPAEIPKLEKAFLEQRGTTVLLLVANDYESAYKLFSP